MSMESYNFCKRCIYQGNQMHCYSYCDGFDHYYLLVRFTMKENEAFCVSCNKVFDKSRVFMFEENPKLGLCFDCY